MGRFIYGPASTTVEFDDRVLAHLKVVITSKLRRGESFLFTWEYATEAGSGHSSVWLHPAIPLQFDLFGNREPLVNRLWLEALTASANSAGGLRILPEPGAEDPGPAHVTSALPGRDRRAH